METSTRKRHILKVKPKYYKPIRLGMKRSLIRKNDSDYRVGDIIILKEYDDKGFTGAVLRFEATYITNYKQREGYVVIGIRLYN